MNIVVRKHLVELDDTAAGIAAIYDDATIVGAWVDIDDTNKPSILAIWEAHDTDLARPEVIPQRPLKVVGDNTIVTGDYLISTPPTYLDVWHVFQTGDTTYVKTP